MEGDKNPRFMLIELSKCKTFSSANQIVRNNHNDEELELFINVTMNR